MLTEDDINKLLEEFEALCDEHDALWDILPGNDEAYARCQAITERQKEISQIFHDASMERLDFPSSRMNENNTIAREAMSDLDGALEENERLNKLLNEARSCAASWRTRHLGGPPERAIDLFPWESTSHSPACGCPACIGEVSGKKDA